MGIRGATGSIMATGDTVGSEIWLLEGPLIRTSYWRNPFVCVCMCLNRGLGPATEQIECARIITVMSVCMRVQSTGN